MAKTLGSIVVDIKANTAKFIKGITKSKTVVAGLKKSLKQLSTGLAVVAGSLSIVIKKSVDSADAIGKNAAAIGLSAEAYQEFAHAADLAGTEQSAFTSNMTAFVKRIGEARNGVGPLVSGLKKYDQVLLSSLQNSKNQEDALNILADAIQDAGSAADRAALANAAFGRSGVHMSNLLKQGSKGLTQFRKEARDLGIILSNETVKSAEDLKDRLTNLGKILTTSVTKAVLENAEGIKKLTKAAIDAVTWLGEFVKKLDDVNKNSLGVDDGGAEAALLQRKKNATNLLKSIKNRIDRETLYEKVFSRSAEKQKELVETYRKQFEVVKGIDALLDKDLERQQKLINGKNENNKLNAPASSNGLDNSESNQDIAARESLIKSAADRFEILKTSLLTESEIRQEAFEKQIDDAANGILFLEGQEAEGFAIIEELTKKHEDEKTRIAKEAEEKRRNIAIGALASTSNILKRASSLMKTEGKKQSSTQKLLAKGSIIASTAVAVMNGLATIPLVPLGLAMAALAAAEGIKQLSKVGGGGGGSTISRSSSVDTTPTNNQPESVTTGLNRQQTATQVIFTGDMLGEDLSERLVDIIRNATNERDIVVFDSDSRQAQEIREAS